MASNPIPTLATDAMWWLAGQLLSLEPRTRLGGSTPTSRGYHNTGQANEDPWPRDYSIRDAPDRRGPSWRTKAAAIDWTFPRSPAGRLSPHGRLRGAAAHSLRHPRPAAGRLARAPLFDGAAPPDTACVVAIGSHQPHVREVDATFVARAALYVEARTAAAREAGELVSVPPHRLVNLAELLTAPVDLTKPRLFKSVGMAWEDIVVAAAAR